MLLYEHPLSSYAQKVKIALREKSLVFDKETPNALGSGKAAGPFSAASPRNEVPALIDGDVTVWDSLAIIEYLAEKFPQSGLWPADRASRAHARSISAERRPAPGTGSRASSARMTSRPRRRSWCCTAARAPRTTICSR